MDLTCDSCSVRFSKPNLKPGDATMCPRCRSLVVAPSAPPPPPPPTPTARREPPQPEPSRPTGAREPAKAHVEAQDAAPAFEEVEAVPEPESEPQRPHVSLARTCPWCHRRYDVELSACPRCGYSAARAQMLRNQADEDAGRAARGVPARPAAATGGAWGVLGLLAAVAALGRVRNGGALVFAALLIGGLIYAATKVKPRGGDDDDSRPPRDRSFRP